MIPAHLAAALLAPWTLAGVVSDGYPGTLSVLTPRGDRIRVAIAVTDPPVWRWDGVRLPAGSLREGDRVRVSVDGEYLGTYAAGEARRVEVGPPARDAGHDDVAFAVAQEGWVARTWLAGAGRSSRGTRGALRAVLPVEEADLVANLGSRSWAVRERATRELMAWPRARLGRPLAWAAVAGDAEARHRAGAVGRAKWMGEGE